MFKYEVLNRLNKKNESVVKELIEQKKALINRNKEYEIRSNQIQKLNKLVKFKTKKIESERQLKKIYLNKLKSKKAKYRGYLVQLEKKKKGINQEIQRLIKKEMERKNKNKRTNYSKKMSSGLINKYANSISINIKGNIISHFGKMKNKEYDISINNDGIEFEALNNIVTTPKTGVIIFADWLKGKGNIVILSVDEHFAMVFANLSEIFVKKGQRVEKNDKIGKIITQENGKEILYFSTWINGNPVDPEIILMR
jgi:septal ring factor EnvC (AmiA/AmiB activator)